MHGTAEGQIVNTWRRSIHLILFVRMKQDRECGRGTRMRRRCGGDGVTFRQVHPVGIRGWKTDGQNAKEREREMITWWKEIPGLTHLGGKPIRNLPRKQWVWLQILFQRHWDVELGAQEHAV